MVAEETTELDEHLGHALATMAEQVACVQDLAQAHGEDDALVELPPMLTNALLLPGLEYVCLSDGQLVDAATLLRGERRGAPYLPLDEAAELQRAELHRTGRQLAQEAEEVERALDAVQALPRAWALRGPDWRGATLAGARPGEFFVFQLGGKPGTCQQNDTLTTSYIGLMVPLASLISSWAASPVPANRKDALTNTVRI